MPDPLALGATSFDGRQPAGGPNWRGVRWLHGGAGGFRTRGKGVVEPELLEVTEDHAFIVYGPIACVIWRGAITRDAVERTEALGMRALQESPRGAGLLFFAEGSAPSQELRELTADINERLAARGAVGVAGVFLARGFLAAVQRGIATGLAMLSAHSYPFRVFSNTRQACDWLGGELRHRGVTINGAEVSARLRDLRDQFVTHGSLPNMLPAT